MKECSQSHFSDKLMDVEIINQGIVLPCVKGRKGGVVDETGKYFAQSFVHKGLGGAYDFDDLECEYCDDEVVYVGMFHSVWGHCLTDNLKLLWFLFDERFYELNTLKFVFTTLHESFEFSDNAKSLLERLGIDVNQLVRVTKITKFKRIYLPEDCFIREEHKGCWYTNEYKSLIDRIVSFPIQTTINDSAKLRDYVYFTRTKLNDAHDHGEERIERVFREMGYAIMSPEQMTLDEQIKVLSHCSVLAATEGSITHNAVFMKEGSSIVIVRKRDFVNEYQLAINEMRALHVTYVDSHMSTRIDKYHSYKGPFFMYCSSNLSKFAKCKKPLFPVFSYMNYLWKYRPKHIGKKVLKKVFHRQSKNTTKFQNPYKHESFRQ